MCVDRLRGKGNVRGSLTVEAALICPLLCLVLCGMIQLTMRLYEQVETYGKMAVSRTEQRLAPADLIRLEAMAAELLQEVE